MSRPMGAFSRTLDVPEGVDVDGIKAKMADGVLTLTMPKAVEEPVSFDVTPEAKVPA